MQVGCVRGSKKCSPSIWDVAVTLVTPVTPTRWRGYEEQEWRWTGLLQLRAVACGAGGAVKWLPSDEQEVRRALWQQLELGGEGCVVVSW